MNLFKVQPRVGQPTHAQHREFQPGGLCPQSQQKASLRAVQQLLQHIANSQGVAQRAKKKSKSQAQQTLWKPPPLQAKKPHRGEWTMVPGYRQQPARYREPQQMTVPQHQGRAFRVLDEHQLPILKRPVKVWMMVAGTVITTVIGVTMLTTVSSRAEKRMDHLDQRIATVAEDAADGVSILSTKVNALGSTQQGLQSAQEQLSATLEGLRVQQARSAQLNQSQGSPEQWATAAVQAATTGRCTEMAVYFERIRAASPIHPSLRDFPRFQQECAAVARGAARQLRQ